MSEHPVRNGIRRERCSSRELEIIRNIITGRETIDDIPSGSRTFSLYRQILPLRKDIISWYPLEEDAEVLEIGAGSGIVTQELCRKTVHVTALDADRELCLLNELRNQNADGLKVLCGRLEDLPKGKKYDLILLNDCITEASDYVSGEEAPLLFLQSVSALLKQNGRCLVSLANRFGMKYFSGAPDEKTGIYFLGQNQYNGFEDRRTYTLEETKSLFSESGFRSIRFYYPYPDHVFPQQIYTDDSIRTYHYGTEYSGYEDGRVDLFSETDAAETAVKEGVMPALANSFLVEAGLEQFDEEETLIYGKINRDRRERFQISTLITRRKNGEKQIRKYALTDDSRSHIRYMHDMESTADCGKVICLKGVQKGDFCRYPFLEDKTLLDLILEAGAKEDSEEIVRLLSKFFREAFSGSRMEENWKTSSFVAVFGEEDLPERAQRCVSPANVDLICENVFPQKDQYTVIDCEWIFPFPVPVSFIIWRNLCQLYNIYGNQLEDVLPRDSIMRKFSLSEEEGEVFQKWDLHFTLQYAGSNGLSRYMIPKKELFLNQFNEDSRVKRMNASVYYDTGEGFCEAQRICRYELIQDGRFELVFSLPELPEGSVKKIRFDPMEGFFCRCRVSAEKEGSMKRLLPINAEITEDDTDLFLTTDPCYEIPEGWIENGCIRVSGTIEILTDQQVSEEMLRAGSRYQTQIQSVRQEAETLRQNLSQARNDYCELQGRHESLQEEKKNLQEEKQRLQKEKGFLEEARQNLKHQVIGMQSLLEEKEWNLQQLKIRQEEEQEKLTVLAGQLREMENTKGWKMLQKFRKIRNRLLHR